MLRSVILGSTLIASSFFSQKFLDSNLKQTEQVIDTSRHAICILFPMPNYPNIQGIVSFSQENFSSQTKIVANVLGLSPNCTHGIAIHEFGDLTEGPSSLGPIYNSTISNDATNLNQNQDQNKGQSQNQDEKVVGDLGYLKSDEKGNGYIAIKDKKIKLFGEQSVIGRSCVIFDSEESAQATNSKDKVKGNIQKIIGFGNIGFSTIFKNIQPLV